MSKLLVYIVCKIHEVLLALEKRIVLFSSEILWKLALVIFSHYILHIDNPILNKVYSVIVLYINLLRYRSLRQMQFLMYCRYITLSQTLFYTIKVFYDRIFNKCCEYRPSSDKKNTDQRNFTILIRDWWVSVSITYII